MNDPHTQTTESAGDVPAVRYERRDVRWRPLVLSFVGLVVLVAGAALAMGGLFRLLAGPSSPHDARVNTSGSIPILRQRDDLRQREQRLLSEYAWVDREQGIVRIPIERAIQLVIQQQRETRHDAQ